MVGRLVEDQKVGFGEHQLCKGNPSFFTTAQISDPFEYIISGELKPAPSVLRIAVLFKAG